MLVTVSEAVAERVPTVTVMVAAVDVGLIPMATPLDGSIGASVGSEDPHDGLSEGSCLPSE